MAVKRRSKRELAQSAKEKAEELEKQALSEEMKIVHGIFSKNKIEAFLYDDKYLEELEQEIVKFTKTYKERPG